MLQVKVEELGDFCRATKASDDLLVWMCFHKQDINTMLNAKSTHFVKQVLNNSCYALGMHITTSRLYKAAEELMKINSQTKLALVLNESPQTVSNWERRGVSKAGMLKAQELIGVNAAWIMTGDGPMTSGPESGVVDLSKYTRPAMIQRVPLLSWVSAGPFCMMEDYSPDDVTFIETTAKNRGRTFALMVSGLSMSPKFPDGCTIIVEPDEVPINGSYVIVRQNRNSEATFKQLSIDGSRRYLIALNPDWPNRIIEMDDDAVICGVVKKIQMDV